MWKRFGNWPAVPPPPVPWTVAMEMYDEDAEEDEQRECGDVDGADDEDQAEGFTE